MSTHLKTFSIVIFIAAFAFTIAACGAPPAPIAAPAQSSPSAIAPSPTLAPTRAPSPTQSAVSFTDSAGRSITLDTAPTRIVSLTPSTTEIVCALGACDKLVGRDQFSDFPSQVASVHVVSDGFNPGYEQIVAAKPDLVLVAAITSPDVIKKLEELKLPTLVVGDVNSSFESVKKDIQFVGQVIGAETQAAQLVGELDKKLADVKAKLANAQTKPRVFWELDATDPAKPYTPGPGTFINEIITLAGGANIAGTANSPYAQLNAEEIIRANPEVIIMSDAAYGVAPESVGKRPGWNVIDAVKNHRVFPIDDNLVSRPGPRVVDGLEAAAKLIHPEVFRP